MAISRVQKFKEYRNSLIKEEAPTLETPKSSANTEVEIIGEDTTSTLPMDEVIKSINENEQELAIAKRQRTTSIIKWTLISAGILLKLKKYESYWTVKKKALLIDKRYELGIWPNLNRRNALQIILQIIALICFIFTASILIIKLVHKIKHDKNTSTILKERNKMIFDIQEKERAKISRDIHDSVVQDIRVLRLETENLVVDEKSKARQTKIADLATDCIIKLRNICYNLTPAELANHNTGDSSKLELISIINSLVQQFSSRTHIPCVFKVEEGFEYPVLEKEKTQNLFRVIQESLTNIEKHSYATQASIFLKKDGNTLFIYITDDGIGCNPNELDKKLKSKEHLGLRSMKDRMELIGGSIEFFTSQNDGMEIKIELPLEDAK